MKTILISLCLSLFSFLDINAQTDFVLEPSQSMLMTGKGAGQDATINPYYGQDCYALIQNIGIRKFSVRIQKDGEIIKELSIGKGKQKKIKLLKGHELYLDPNPKGIAKARIAYEELEQ